MTQPLLCVVSLLAAAAPPADAREAARVVLERDRYQTELPTGAPRPGATTAADATIPAARPASGGDAPDPRGGAAMPSIPLPPAGLVWVVLATLAVIGLAWALRHVVAARRNADVEPVPEPERAAPPARRPLRIGPLTDVEDLARQGRFGEAIHLLLLHLFAALQRRPATAPAPAHTSREVLARTRLAGDARTALGVLVGAAEHIHFGGRVAAREDYEICLGHYRRFLDAFERAS